MPFSLPTHWWSFAARGALAALFGVFTVAAPELTLATFVLLFGCYAFAEGAANAFGAFRAASEGDLWWPLVAEGVLSMGVGLLLFGQPNFGWHAMLNLVAFWALATGALEVFAAARLRARIESEWLLGLASIASLALGIVLALAPAPDPLKVVFWLGVYALSFGALLLTLGLRLRGYALDHEQTTLGPPLEGV